MAQAAGPSSATETSPLVPPSDGRDQPLPPFSFRELIRFTGPGLMMSLAYIDPGNLEAEVQLGAYTGARLIWVLWWATAIGALLQELAARIGMVSGHDLAHAVRALYPRWVTYTVYANLEVAIMTSDLQDLVGTAHAIRLLTGLPLYLGVVVSSALSMLLLYVYEAHQRHMEVGVGVVILVVMSCFFINMFRAQQFSTEDQAHRMADLAEGMFVPGMQWWAHPDLNPNPNPNPNPDPNSNPNPNPNPNSNPTPNPNPNQVGGAAVARLCGRGDPAAHLTLTLTLTQP